jgi:NDP-sugar pyrophosphorylase family protein
MQAIILAGGKGTRLKPFTITIPKPLMPIGEVPILEVVLKQLKANGFDRIYLTVNHLAELITAFFGNGEKLGVDIKYSLEKDFLGTAGPLGLLDTLDDDFLVMNGDLLTTISYSDLFQFHKKNGNDVTIATYQKEVKIDLGVLKTEGVTFIDYIEKPTYHFTVSMGIYVFSKRCVASIERGKRLDMNDFVLRLKNENKKIMCYSGDYIWLDIGRVEDYEKAVDIFVNNEKEFLK